MSIHNVNPPAFSAAVKNEGPRYPNPNLHRVLLVASAGLSIASVIPASRQIASMILRSVAFISSSAICADSWEREDVGNRLFNITRIGIVALGIIGVATAKPALFVASLAAEVGLQTFELGKALYDRDVDRILTHMGILVIDSLMLAAVASGAWQVMVTAAAVNAAVMLMFAAKAADQKDEGSAIDILCYLALAGVSIAASVETAKIVGRKLISADYKFKNRSQDVEYVYHEKTKELICTVKPGETVSFTTDVSRVNTQVRAENGYPVERRAYWRGANHCHFKPIVRQQPMNTKLYSTLPIGGTIVVDRIQN